MISIAAHAAVALIFIFGPAFMLQEKPKEPVQWIDLAPNLGEGGQSSGGTVTPPPAPQQESPEQTPPQTAVEPPPPAVEQPPPPPPAREPEPPPEPVKPVDPENIVQSKPQPKQSQVTKTPVTKEQKKTTPKPPPKPTPVSKPPVTTDTKKVTKSQATTPPVKASKPNADSTDVKVSSSKVVRRIVKGATPTHANAAESTSTESSFNAKAFAEGIMGKLPGGLVSAKGATGSGTSASGKNTDYSAYNKKIYQEMYNAWQSPFGLPTGTLTIVTIRVEKTGNISKVSLASSSGNKEMDDSAIRAANNVKKLPPLPDGFEGSYADINIHFKVQK